MYDVIRRDFGFDYLSDWAAASVLSEILQTRYGGRAQQLVSKLGYRIRGSKVLVVGAYDTCVRCAEVAKEYDVVVAADGASLCCADSGRVPDVVVTDLDGILSPTGEEVCEGLLSNALLVVHAHGDNIDLLVKGVPRLASSNEVIGTCQVRPPQPLRIFGGFTDGDRAAYLAYYFGASRLGLLGFNLEGGVIGRYSKPRGHSIRYAVKVRKLKWANMLLAYLRQACGEDGVEWVEEG